VPARNWNKFDEDDVAVLRGRRVDLLAIEIRVILIAEIARLLADCDLLGETGPERVRARDDDAVLDAEFEECVPAGADLREEVLVRHRDLAVLVPALLFVADLVLNLERAGSRLDHLPRQQIRRLRIAEAGVDVGDDRHDVRLVVFDRVQQPLLLDLVTCGARGVDIAEHHAEFAGVGLAQECVEFLDQCGDAGLLVHRLVRQRAELAPHRRYHPAGKVQIPTLGRAEMLLDADHLLLRDEAVPAAERLRVVGGVGVIGGHVLAHDRRGVARDVQAGGEPVLQPHARDGLRRDRVPGAVSIGDEVGHLCDMRLIGHGRSSSAAMTFL
jgi:hypothetical protein